MLTRRRGGAEGTGKFKERRLNESAIGEDDKQQACRKAVVGQFENGPAK
jgi:hypothetical protein